MTLMQLNQIANELEEILENFDFVYEEAKRYHIDDTDFRRCIDDLNKCLNDLYNVIS